MERLKSETRTVILYEAPHRLLALLKDIEEVLGNRQISISRELTKLHEETFRGNVLEGIKKFETQKPRGEFVIVIKGAEIKEEDIFKDISIKEHIKLYMEEGLSKKDAIKKVAQVRGISKNLVYKESIEIK